MSKIIVCHDYKNKKYKVPAENLEFRASAYAVVFKGNKVLLSREWDGYDFPGGGVEKGEKIEQGAVREVHEETGIKIKIGPMLTFAQDFFKAISEKRFFQSHLFYFLGKNPKGKISDRFIMPGERKFMVKAEWADLKNIKNIKFYNAIDSIKLIQTAYRTNKTDV